MKSPPDRACITKGSRFYFDGCARLRISIDGVEQHDHVIEYCVSAGWARVHVLKDGKKQPGAIGHGWASKMVHGRVVVWWADQSPPPGAIVPGAENLQRATVPNSPQ